MTIDEVPTHKARTVSAHCATFAPSLLASITAPEDLSHLDATQLAVLVREIRQFLIAKVSATGGHLGPNLGVVELTIALHRVFDSPNDRILFDTGHQTYVHKLLTGRHAEFDRLRQAGGLSGYPSRRESVHDIIENSHASTALSYADGLAKAHALRPDTHTETADRHIVAVVGDGALTGGMCWEALNNISAAPDRPVIIVLNDNGRSYAPTIGGLAQHLTTLRHTNTGHTNTGQRGADASQPPRTLFEQLGLAYLGPVDGHDIAATEQALRHAAALRRPVVVHCVTVKGKGYRPAETDLTDCMHSVGVLDPGTGRSAAPGTRTWTDVFANHLCTLGGDDRKVVAITAAMPGPTGLHRFGDAFPDRMFDVGISEQHALTSAAGLALGGLHPVVAIYATFLGRAFDQILMDLALHQLPVTIVLDRAGITGPDGPSHHGMWDLAMLSAVPGLRVAAPRDPARLRELFTEAVHDSTGPTVLRFPKATAGTDLPTVAHMDGLDILHRSTHRPLDVLLVATGVTAAPCLQAADILQRRGIGVTVVDPRWVVPIHPTLIHLAARHQLTVTIEDALRVGGVGAAIAQACADASLNTAVVNLGLPRAFLAHGQRADLLAAHGLDADGIAEAATLRLGMCKTSASGYKGGIDHDHYVDDDDCPWDIASVGSHPAVT
jgi:1-deoxy-D-xylulose-5-phosphate synthase